jgi:3-isopropylmalate dehydrogenase
VFRVSDGLYLDTVRAVAREFTDVKLEEEIVDAMAAKLVRHPERYDVVLATNFYADILSDLASELSGSLGLAGSIMAGEALCAAQAQHGSAPDIAGKDKANPTSLILSAAMMLEWLGGKKKSEHLSRAGRAMDEAVDRVLAKPEMRTADLGGRLGTRAFGEAVAAAL